MFSTRNIGLKATECLVTSGKKKKKAGSQLHHTKTQIRCVRVAGLEEVPMINKNTEESPKIKAFSAVASRSHASIEESSHSVLL